MNQNLQWSLNFIKDHYPAGQLELLAMASSLEPAAPEEAPRITLPFNKNYPPRLVVLVGLTDITYLDWLMTQPEIQKEVKQFIILINNAQDVCNALSSESIKKYLVSPHFRFILCPGIASCKPLLFNILKQPQYSKVMDSAQLFPNRAANDTDDAVHEAFCNSFSETVFHVYHNYGRIDDSLEGVRATILNTDKLLNCPGIQDLKDFAKGKTAAVVGAGPSLDADIKTLAKNKDKLIIFAADAAVKPLLKHGIIPDYTTSIERGNLYQIPFWKDLPKIDTELVFFPVVHPEVLKLYPGPMRVVYRNYSYYAYFEKSWPKGLMQSGGSTSHLANRLAFYSGCDKVILVGIDSVYQKQEGTDLYRSHCHGLGHEEWASYHPLEYFSTNKKHQPAFDCILNNGKIGKTNITYHQWAKEFSEEVFSLGAFGRLFTSSLEGIEIPNIPYISLEEFCSQLPEIKKEDRKPKNKPVVNINREVSHKGLLKNVRGWLNLVNEILSNTEELSSPTRNDIALLHNTIYHKFLEDHMFVGFVIQNCAAEFYKLENQWSALSLDLNEDLEARLNVIKKHALLYKQVLGKLEKILENPEEDIK